MHRVADVFERDGDDFCVSLLLFLLDLLEPPLRLEVLAVAVLHRDLLERALVRARLVLAKFLLRVDVADASTAEISARVEVGRRPRGLGGAAQERSEAAFAAAQGEQERARRKKRSFVAARFVDVKGDEPRGRVRARAEHAVADAEDLLVRGDLLVEFHARAEGAERERRLRRALEAQDAGVAVEGVQENLRHDRRPPSPDRRARGSREGL